MKQKAREYGVNPSTIERDYAQNWLLMALSSLPLVLKGGTGISI
jgi:predicted nucleotidyltransferase component of viral defense system